MLSKRLFDFARAVKRWSEAPVSETMYALGKSLSMSGERRAALGNELMQRATARLARKAVKS